MNARVREVLNRQKRSSEFVFTSEKTGDRLIDVKKAFSSARLEAGIPDFQLRDLRHSCATPLSDKDEELVTVAEILGYTDIRMTKRYSHGMHERKRLALEKLVSNPPRQPDAKNVKNKNGRVRALPQVLDIGGAEGGRTPDLRIANAALCQTELLPHVGCHIRKPG